MLGRGFPQSTFYIASGMGELPDSQQVTPNLITSTGDVFALVVSATNEVTPALIDQTGAVFSLSIVYIVAPDLITQTGAVFDMAVTGGDQPLGSADDIRHFLSFGVPI